ncbi:ribosomal-protein-alanine N-acetyltransferase [Maritalea mobilis]|uniref:Ribosomal-protein-alanine N-acetyltransferase n=1 Tax=Maritalea mobilis TaxID=483324 RepID=A0A4R6VP20_9HYPH|nr:ribosomal-protein-alanine N-acetyltransferase [Maritalea mobilis]
MVIGRFFSTQNFAPLESKRLILRLPEMEDYPQWAELRAKSQTFLRPFEPRWGETELARFSFRHRVKKARADAAADKAYAFLLFEKGPNPKLVGGLNLSNLRRRVAQTVTLGYWVGVDQINKGIMSEAVARVLPFIFDELDLHRAEAACLVDNQRSMRVLEKNGFMREGQAEGYLKIDGKWQDHVLFGLTKERYIDHVQPRS